MKSGDVSGVPFLVMFGLRPGGNFLAQRVETENPIGEKSGVLAAKRINSQTIDHPGQFAMCGIATGNIGHQAWFGMVFTPV
ncbi:MAG TPA: hypothetical protein VMV89_12680 [Candidatus Paceibacterota bacterium]|nr:hypothetical protein [Candidatus Paceibacterota bacterium]